MINTIKMFNQNIERKFWEIVIPLMRKEPKIVGKLVAIGYYFMGRIPKQNFLVQSIFWICIGLSLGLGIGILLP
ncbi:MAG TPA: hypothetical protein DCY42_13520 [Chloroflexi bacterium]|nr:hypothetical protein [Chloroflexota bacterium]